MSAEHQRARNGLPPLRTAYWLATRAPGATGHDPTVGSPFTDSGFGPALVV
jgi:hypothetical protein